MGNVSWLRPNMLTLKLRFSIANLETYFVPFKSKKELNSVTFINLNMLAVPRTFGSTSSFVLIGIHVIR